MSSIQRKSAFALLVTIMSLVATNLWAAPWGAVDYFGLSAENGAILYECEEGVQWLGEKPPQPAENAMPIPWDLGFNLDTGIWAVPVAMQAESDEIYLRQAGDVIVPFNTSSLADIQSQAWRMDTTGGFLFGEQPQIGQLSDWMCNLQDLGGCAGNGEKNPALHEGRVLVIPTGTEIVIDPAASVSADLLGEIWVERKGSDVWISIPQAEEITLSQRWYLFFITDDGRTIFAPLDGDTPENGVVDGVRDVVLKDFDGSAWVGLVKAQGWVGIGNVDGIVMQRIYGPAQYTYTGVGRVYPGASHIQGGNISVNREWEACVATFHYNTGEQWTSPSFDWNPAGINVFFEDERDIAYVSLVFTYDGQEERLTFTRSGETVVDSGVPDVPVFTEDLCTGVEPAGYTQLHAGTNYVTSGATYWVRDGITFTANFGTASATTEFSNQYASGTSWVAWDNPIPESQVEAGAALTVIQQYCGCGEIVLLADTLGHWIIVVVVSEEVSDVVDPLPAEVPTFAEDFCAGVAPGGYVELSAGTNYVTSGATYWVRDGVIFTANFGTADSATEFRNEYVLDSAWVSWDNPIDNSQISAGGSLFVTQQYSGCGEIVRVSDTLGHWIIIVVVAEEPSDPTDPDDDAWWDDLVCGIAGSDESKLSGDVNVVADDGQYWMDNNSTWTAQWEGTFSEAGCISSQYWDKDENAWVNWKTEIQGTCFEAGESVSLRQNVNWCGNKVRYFFHNAVGVTLASFEVQVR